MSDNITAPIPNGTILAADDVGGTLYPRTKLSFGGNGVAVDVAPASPLPTDSVVRSALVSRSALVGETPSELMSASATRRGFAIQNQSETAVVYFNVSAVAATDQTSLKLAPGAYFESSSHHVGVGAVSIVSTEADTPVYAREW